MISIGKIFEDALERIPTTIVTATTTTMGLVSKFSDYLPSVHDLLGNLAIIAGIVACIALAIVHKKRAALLEEQRKNVALQSKLRQLEIDRWAAR
jgi:hypothetical protein